MRPLLCALFITLAIFPAICGAEGIQRDKASDADYRLYLEAVKKINKHAVFADEKIDWNGNARDSIGTYLHKKDAYSDYLTKEEYSRFKEIQRNNFVGIGMEIEKAPDGGILCFPLISGPAWDAGVSTGDRLEKIDGVPVRGKSLFGIAAMTRGRDGSRVDLTVRSEKGEEKRLAVIRSRITWESVSKQRRGDFSLSG